MKEKRMTGPEVLDVARDAIVTLVLVSAPLMLVGLVVGVSVALVDLNPIRRAEEARRLGGVVERSHSPDSEKLTLSCLPPDAVPRAHGEQREAFQ